MIQRSFGAAAALACLAAAAQAQSFQFNVQQNLSTVQITSEIDVALPGSVIGDFDALTNPAGTRTLPGLFGGSGNQPVPMDIALLTDLAVQGQPSGGFAAQVDLGTSTIVISNFALDTLGGNPGQADLTLELLYQSFRTFQPTSLFPGGIPLPLPLGQASISGLVFQQSGPGAGVLVPDLLLPDTYLVTALVPADVSFTIDALGQVIPVGPLPLALPVLGTLTLLPGGGVQLVLQVAQSSAQTLPDPFPGQTIDNVPLAVPTVLPPGGIANLLVNAVFAEIAFTFDSQIALVANGLPICLQEDACTSFPNSTGAVATIAVVGSVSVSANNMAIQSTHLPANRIGTFLFGNQAKQLPFAAGVLCVGGGQIYRLPPVRSDAFGVSTSVVDFSLPSPKYQALVPGSVWYFQLIYRDQAFGPPAGNTSNALRLQFCP